MPVIGPSGWQDKRSLYVFFYEAADENDALLMDALLVSHLALVTALAMRTHALDREAAAVCDRTIQDLESEYMEVRNAVAHCAAFFRIKFVERMHLEHSLFRVPFPESSVGGPQ